MARPGFDDSLRLRPGVGSWLVRLAPLIRPLVQAKWAARVAARNSDLVDAERLDEFLFGAQRVSLQRVRGPLAEAQGRECFYGDGRLGARCAVDHFLPWSRHPDNTIDNLVAAHPRCNNAKSASLASLDHLRHWLARFQPGDPASTATAHIETQTGWPRRSDRVLSTARATYLWLPEGTRLWQTEHLRITGHNQNARFAHIRDMSPAATSVRQGRTVGGNTGRCLTRITVRLAGRQIRVPGTAEARYLDAGCVVEC